MTPPRRRRYVLVDHSRPPLRDRQVATNAPSAGAEPADDELAHELFGQNRAELIKAAAFRRAALRKFRDGNPDDDWYAAEGEIDALLARARRVPD